MFAKYTTLSGNIAVHVISIFHRSLQAAWPQKWIHTIHRDTFIQCGHCNQEKGHQRQIDVCHYNHYIWLYGPDFPNDITRYTLQPHVISTRKILLKTISTTRFLVEVPRNFSQCNEKNKYTAQFILNSFDEGRPFFSFFNEFVVCVSF